jgi:hypothetical protein
VGEPSNENKNTVSKETILAWVIGIIVIVSVFGFVFIGNTGDSESVNSNATGNPYSFTSIDHDCSDFDTQEDAQMFFEANGGLDEDPHDLDRDNDGMAYDWNP